MYVYLLIRVSVATFDLLRLLCYMYVIQERTDNVDKRRQDIEKANKKHAELKKRRDNATNRRK